MQAEYPNLDNHLVPFGFKEAMTETEIFQLCYDNNLVSLWNLHTVSCFEIKNTSIHDGSSVDVLVFLTF